MIVNSFNDKIKAKNKGRSVFMPWENKTVEEQRKQFLTKAKESNNFSKLCREYEITRKTGYKWLKREALGESLKDKSHAPKNVTNKTTPKIENLILTVRDENPAWGGKTIRKVLENNGYDNLPCVKTCNNILKRNARIETEESLKRKTTIRFEKEHCNEMWQTDFKGDFALLDKTRCFPLTIIDDHARFSIKIAVKPNTLGVTDSFREAFYEYGLPLCVLSDNGAQFAGFRGGYTRFERWLMEHDVLPIHGRIMHPQTQGKIERFHRTMKEELLNLYQFANLAEADKGLQKWRLKYNETRPHHALSMRCPADVYERSNREYYDKVKDFEYDGNIRKVNSWGYLRFDKWQFYLSETFVNEYLEICENPHGDLFDICFRNFKIAQFSADGKLLNRKISRR